MTIRRMVATALAAACTLTVAGPALPTWGDPPAREQFHDSIDEVLRLCGLRVRFQQEADGFWINRRGKDRMAYALEVVHASSTYTNLATGKTLSDSFNVATNYTSITDNGDGTLSITVLSTGSFKIFGPDGEFLFNDPGQVRVELLVDHGGTPTDPTDDTDLDATVIKDSTGRNDLEGRDLCEDLVQFTS